MKLLNIFHVKQQIFLVDIYVIRTLLSFYIHIYILFDLNIVLP